MSRIVDRLVIKAANGVMHAAAFTEGIIQGAYGVRVPLRGLIAIGAYQWLLARESARRVRQGLAVCSAERCVCRRKVDLPPTGFYFERVEGSECALRAHRFRARSDSTDEWPAWRQCERCGKPHTEHGVGEVCETLPDHCPQCFVSWGSTHPTGCPFYRYIKPQRCDVCLQAPCDPDDDAHFQTVAECELCDPPIECLDCYTKRTS